jgi:putative peptidoglycan lipid II flippase
MVAALVWLAGDLESWLALGAGGRARRLTLCVLVGAGVYFAGLAVTGARPRDFAGRPRAV